MKDNYPSHREAAEFVGQQEHPESWEIRQYANGNKVAWQVINADRFNRAGD